MSHISGQRRNLEPLKEDASSHSSPGGRGGVSSPAPVAVLGAAPVGPQLTGVPLGTSPSDANQGRYGAVGPTDGRYEEMRSGQRLPQGFRQ